MIKEPEDEAFDELAKAQQRKGLLVDKGCAERGCMGYDSRDGDKPTAMYTVEALTQIINEMRPAIRAMDRTKGMEKTTEEWFDAFLQFLETNK